MPVKTVNLQSSVLQFKLATEHFVTSKVFTEVLIKSSSTKIKLENE